MASEPESRDETRREPPADEVSDEQLAEAAGGLDPTAVEYDK